MLSIKKSVFQLKHRIDEISDCTESVFIQTNGIQGEHYYFLVDFPNALVTCWEVDTSKAKRFFQELISQQMQVEWVGYPINYLNFSLMPHTAVYSGNDIFVSSINSSYIIRLDIDSDDYEIIHNDKEPEMFYSSTNSYYNGDLYYSKYNVFDAIAMAPDKPIRNVLGKYNVRSRVFSEISSFNCPITMHQTSVTNKGNNIISVGICTTPKVKYPSNRRYLKDPDFMRNILEQGLNESYLVNYDVQGNAYSEFTTNDCIAHIEYDEAHPEIGYISAHNLGFNGDSFGNDILSFGPGAMYKYNYKSHTILGRYSSDDFFRLTTHYPFRYQDRSYVAVTVFPSQIHLLDADTMELNKKIFLGPSSVKVDFSNGPYKYPKMGKTPYMVLPIKDRPLFFYGGLTGLKVYDFMNEKPLGTINYNMWGKPLTAIGHPIIFHRQ